MISKDRATPPSVPFIGPFFYDYTVFVDDENFTVTEPNDMTLPGLFLPALRRGGRAGAGGATQAQTERPDRTIFPLDGAADLSDVQVRSISRRPGLEPGPIIPDVG